MGCLLNFELDVKPSLSLWWGAVNTGPKWGLAKWLSGYPWKEVKLPPWLRINYTIRLFIWCSGVSQQNGKAVGSELTSSWRLWRDALMPLPPSWHRLSPPDRPSILLGSDYDFNALGCRCRSPWQPHPLCHARHRLWRHIGRTSPDPWRIWSESFCRRFACSSSVAAAARSVSGLRSLSAAVGGPLRLKGQSMKTTSSCRVSDAKNVPSHQTARRVESVQPRLLRLFVMRP